MKIIINVLNEEILDNLLWLLKHFEKDGVEIIKSEEDKEEWSDEYIEKNWKEIGMKTNSVDFDDDEKLYEAVGEFYNEKYSD
ncbi:hypothetical protein SULAZ_0346 [Sulfurihydrogenibium azorense Az-Fu1]|uniref:Uncharacterized protein n=1 Tax=Sulfurihydrogenibium azorense (strain DSM 15241 / OCM 825 / Az-Fu1) TaxID=204536 RepID=C1DTA3_SULAA|nr:MULTISPECIES: hypothetical protein [Sulfurihydrogenibium]ACN99479.1 hypothetical protein SULAZ_0346 [Sulfurihydrogenibium azorense Az-Fu1]